MVGYFVEFTPISPTIAIDVIAGDDVLNAAEATQPLVISGTSTGVVGRTVTVGLNGNNYTGTVAGDGTWSVTVPQSALLSSMLPDGSYTVTADVSDQSGNAAQEATRTLTVQERTFFNGFEGIGRYASIGNIAGGYGPTTASYAYNTDYSEGGITVRDVITGAAPDAAVVVNAINFWGGVGNYNWYTAASGYTDIRLTNGGNFQSLQLLEASGHELSGDDTVAYELLDEGKVVSAGILPDSTTDTGAGYQILTFSGGNFDDLRIQRNSDPPTFDPNAFDVQAIVNISATSTPFVSGGQTYNVPSGQIDNGDIVLSGGTTNVLSGGTANDTIVSSGGTLFVLPGGLVDPTVIFSGGLEIVSSGGTDLGAQISGGEQDVFGYASGAALFTGSQVVKSQAPRAGLPSTVATRKSTAAPARQARS
jgi:autotransporter passenger strand-loop-strand repeat protein